MRLVVAVLTFVGVSCLAGGAFAQEAPASAVEALRSEATKLQPIAESQLARDFLAATAHLTEPTPRTIHLSQDRARAYSPAQYESLDAAAREGLTQRELPASMYYNTFYGSPLVYARVLEAAARHGVDSLRGRRVLDFGCGTIGHLQLMSHLGADVVGIDVDPLMSAIYSEPSDQGAVGDGKVALHVGQWPAEDELRRTVGGAFDLITSKNTLKAGYLHPNPPAGKTVNERQLVKLGVDDDAFLRAVRAALKPGGLFVLYNISPAQTPADDPSKPYLPWADGNTPFTREQFAKAGFEVLEFDQVDNEKLFDVWLALGYDQGQGRDSLPETLFSHLTVARAGAERAP